MGTHREPDGDAIGSLLGLGHILKTAGIRSTLACADPVPADLRFLPGASGVVSRGPEGEDLIVALDAGDLGRLGDLIAPEDWARRRTVVLDHHASNSGYGSVDVVVPDVASTSELVLDLARLLGVKPTPEAATCLLTGILTDTLGFRTSNTTSGTLRRAADLVDSGGPLSDIVEKVFASRPLHTMLLLGRALESLKVIDGLGVAILSVADLDELGAGAADTRGISSFLATTRELAAVALLKERPDGKTDVSMRSKPGIDLVPVARRLGGGGHPQAAGATLGTAGPEATAQVWRALRRGIGQAT